MNNRTLLNILNDELKNIVRYMYKNKEISNTSFKIYTLITKPKNKVGYILTIDSNGTHIAKELNLTPSGEWFAELNLYDECISLYNAAQ